MNRILPQLSPTTNWYVSFALLSVALVVGVVWVTRVLRDVKGEEDAATTPTRDLTHPLDVAYFSGLMSDEEYRRVKSSADKLLRPGEDSRSPSTERGEHSRRSDSPEQAGGSTSDPD